MRGYVPLTVLEIELGLITEVILLLQGVMQVKIRHLASTAGSSWERSWERTRKASSNLISNRFFRFLTGGALVAHALLLVVLYEVVAGNSRALHMIVSLFLVPAVVEFSASTISLGLLGYMLNFPADFTLVIADIVTRSIFLSQALGPQAPSYALLVPVILRFAVLSFRLSSGKLIFAVFVGVGSDLAQIAISMTVIGFAYGAVGYWIFGGKLFISNPDLAGTSYAINRYFFHNFNTMPRSLVVLFQFTFLNDFPATMSGIMAVTTRTAGFYFLVWFLLVVAVLLNVFMSAITRPYVILKADLSKVSAACRTFGLGEEVIRTFLWKEADFVEDPSSVWSKKLDHLGHVHTYLRDLDDDISVQMVGQVMKSGMSPLQRATKPFQRKTHPENDQGEGSSMGNV